jgi:predicted component of type VI protein secretion system
MRTMSRIVSCWLVLAVAAGGAVARKRATVLLPPTHVAMEGDLEASFVLNPNMAAAARAVVIHLEYLPGDAVLPVSPIFFIKSLVFCKYVTIKK